MNYDKQAKDFLKETNTTIEVQFLKYDYHFNDDEEKRDIYTVTIQRNQRKFVSNFGQSIFNSRPLIANTMHAKELSKSKNLRAYNKEGGLIKTKNKILSYNSINSFSLNERDFSVNSNFEPPTEYDILSGLIHYEVGTLQDFCDNFGYDSDSIRASKTYEAVLNEWQNVCMLWSDSEIEKLQEIQ